MTLKVIEVYKKIYFLLQNLCLKSDNMKFYRISNYIERHNLVIKGSMTSKVTLCFKTHASFFP